MRTLLRLVCVTLVATSAWALPSVIAQEGLVIDGDGQPLGDEHDIRIRLYDRDAGGMPLFEELHRDVEFDLGYYSVLVGSVQELDGAIFLNEAVFVEVVIDDEALTPRLPLGKVPGAFVADVALSVVGDINPNSVSIDGEVVINDAGQWVGDPANLRGAQGEQGPAGPAGPQGPAGAGGEAADPDDVVQALADNPDALPFIRDDANDSKTGHLTMSGGNLNFAGNSRNALSLGNSNVVGVNRLRINDPGQTEGIHWDGTQASIVVSPANGANSDGLLRLRNDDAISLESEVRVSGRLVSDNGDGVGFNRLRINDPGPTEGIHWDGSQASIVVSPANGANTDGMLRLRNDDAISLESDVQVTGALSVAGAMSSETSVTAPRGVFASAALTNATIGTLAGNTTVSGDLTLQGDVALGAETDFTGTLRVGAVAAVGNVSAGGNGRVTAGSAGFYVGDVRVFDGNGNLLVPPVYACGANATMVGTTDEGRAICRAVACAPGSAFRGWDGNGAPLCEADDVGLQAIPVNNCAAGQAIRGIAANGVTTCGSPRSGSQECDDGEFVTGLTAAGTVVCENPGGDGPPDNRIFASCLAAREAGFRVSGVYRLRPPGEGERRVYCDQTTDEGGWTLVASTRNTTLNDQGTGYYDDIQRLAPNGGHDGIWNGMRNVANNWDVRFTCRRNGNAAADAAFDVDLSFYEVPWYEEWANAANDGQSCFEERNGQGDLQPAPMRRNNLNGQTRDRGNNWDAGYLEGEDSCGDTGDFTIDFDNRGMDSNQGDGTDWGEDDSSRKCGSNGLGGGQWFIFTREREGGGGGAGCQRNQNIPNGTGNNGRSCGNGAIDLGCLPAGQNFTVSGNTCGAGNNHTTCRNTQDRIYRFTVDGNRSVRFETCDGASYDTRLVASRNVCNGNQVTCNDDACGLRSRIQFNASAGTTYFMAVEAYTGNQCGNYTLRVISN